MTDDPERTERIKSELDAIEARVNAARQLQDEIDRAGMGDPRDATIRSLRESLDWNVEQRTIQAKEIERLRGRLHQATERSLHLPTTQENEIERLKHIAIAARELVDHSEQGYASLVSYLIRLKEALNDTH